MTDQAAPAAQPAALDARHRQSQWIYEKRAAVAANGMVTAMHPLAAAAGLEVLRAGGNAVDAAVATAFAVGVVEPFMSGVGGVAAMVIYLAEQGRAVVVDGSSVAPDAARPDTFPLLPVGASAGIYGWRGTVGDAQNTGFRSPIVPGQPGCLLHAHARFGSGRLSRREVMAPAIRLAEEGFAVDPYVAQTIAFAQRRLRAFPETLRTFFHEDGTPLTPATLTRPADRLAQPDLARTLRALAEGGPDVLYRGEVGERLVADLQANGGLISREDLAAFRVRELDPLRARYRGHTLLGLPRTSGCVTAYEALGILEHFDLAGYGAGSPEATHLVAEALRRAFRDRFAHLADPRHQPAPFDGLLAPGYVAERAGTIRLDRADPEAGPGDPWRFEAGGRPAVAAGAGATGGDTCTTHLTVVDGARNVVALTSTLGELFGCGVVPRGTGILLNNGLTWFDPEPGHVNSIAPGKRILWAPTPTVVLRGEGSDAAAWAGLGAPGGRRIMSAVVQCLVNLVDFGLGIQPAVAAPRVHCEGPGTLADGRLAPEVLEGLRARGHRLEVVEETATSFSFARPNGITVDAASGTLTGGVHQYTPAWAMGY